MLRRFSRMLAFATILVVGAVSTACIASGPASPSNATAVPSSVPSTALPDFSVQLGGRSIRIGTSTDCEAISSSFLNAWCLGAVDPRLPTDPTKLTASDNPMIEAVLARALMSGNDAACDEPVVALWISIGSHVANGSAACRESLKSLTAQGYFTVTDPETGESLKVVLG